jgi:hypothetical protein
MTAGHNALRGPVTSPHSHSKDAMAQVDAAISRIDKLRPHKAAKLHEVGGDFGVATCSILA